MRRMLVIAGVVWLELFRRKDLYVMLILLAALLLALMTVNLFGLGAVVRYVMDTGMLMTWLFSLVLVVGLAARQLPQEESRGTIFPLLAKPLTRGELLLGKWLGAWTACLAATGVFYGLVLMLTGLRGGTFDRVCLAQALGLHAAALGLVGALALVLSTRLTYGAAATLTFVVCGAAFLVAPAVPTLLRHTTEPAAGALFALYYALPHLELFDLRQRLIHDWGPAPWTVVLGVGCYGAVWSALLLTAAWLAYRGKPFRRGPSA